jgi:hypothetical protein
MATFTREYERITCPGCHRTISAYIPHFGDGSGLRVVKHNLLPASAHRTSIACPCSERILVREHGRWTMEH